MPEHPSLLQHRLLVCGGAVPGVQALVELRLNVRTTAKPEDGKWAITFDAPKDVNLDFLRPNVLPPRHMTAQQYVRYIKTGHRDPEVYLPDVETMREAQEILVRDGVIEKTYV